VSALKKNETVMAFVCTVCYEEFADYRSVALHKELAHLSPWKFEHGGEDEHEECALRKHKFRYVKHPTTYPCDACSEIFFTFKESKRHSSRCAIKFRKQHTIQKDFYFKKLRKKHETNVASQAASKKSERTNAPKMPTEMKKEPKENMDLPPKKKLMCMFVLDSNAPKVINCITAKMPTEIKKEPKENMDLPPKKKMLCQFWSDSSAQE